VNISVCLQVFGDKKLCEHKCTICQCVCIRAHVHVCMRICVRIYVCKLKDVKKSENETCLRRLRERQGEGGRGAGHTQTQAILNPTKL